MAREPIPDASPVVSSRSRRGADPRPPPFLASGDAPRSNLPLSLTSFIGRETQVAEVTQLVRSHRLVTVTGAGGVGKTRLALQVAAGLVAAFTDGVWHAELAPLADPQLVPNLVAGVLGLWEQPGRSFTEVLTHALEPRNTALVLDNCEHLADACRELAIGLLQACPKLHILATSRQPLAARQEVVWRLPSLTLLDAREELSAETWQRSEAIRLFLDRAVTARPTLRLREEDLPLAAETCRRLDGIPLAIELAAARLKVLTLAEIAERLTDRFRLLTGGHPAALPRHRTLRALVDWSYELLDEPERVLLRRLSVFAGGCSLEAVEAVCTGDGLEPAAVLDVLDQLVDHSVVVAEEGLVGMRYRLLETIRAYGSQQLDAAGEATAVRDRHLAWYSALAQRTEAEFYGPEELTQYRRQQQEEANFRAALDWVERAGQSEGPSDGMSSEARRDLGLRLAGSLRWFWLMRGRLAEGHSLLTRVLAGTGPDCQSIGRANALNTLGYLDFARGNLGEAQRYCADALACARTLDHAPTLLTALWANGQVSMVQGELDAAERCFAEQQALASELGFGFELAEAIYFLGEVALLRGDAALARARLTESLAHARAAGDLWCTGMVLARLGHVAVGAGEFGPAEGLLREALQAVRAFDDAVSISLILEDLAATISGQGRVEQAARLLGAIDALNDAHGAPILPTFQALHDQTRATAASALGESAFASAWAAGRSLSYEELIADAFADEGGTPSASSRGEAGSGARWAPLTPREAAVAALIAQGLTNRQIAEQLVISELTAESHVRNILHKLGFASRARVAAWSADRGLTPPAAPTDHPAIG